MTGATLHLFNQLGAPTERTWLDATLGSRTLGWPPTLAYETLDPACPTLDAPMVQLRRVNVAATDDPAAQMDALATDVDDPATRDLLSRDFAVVHGHFGPRLLVAAPWIKRGTPTLISLYGYDASRLLRDPSWIGRYRWAADHGAVFLVLANAMRDRLVDHGLPADQVRIVRLGVNVADWKFAPSPPESPPRFVFVGRLAPKKGVADLLDAVALLRAGGDAVRLDVLGDGPLEHELRARTDQLGLADSVHLHGMVDRRSIPQRLSSAAALVLPSVTAPDGDEEGTPVVLMEAQALGVPCITTRHAGNAEVLPPDAADRLVPEHAPAALAAAMHAVMRWTPAERQAACVGGRQWIEANHDLRHMVAAYAALYASCAAAMPR